MNIINRNTINNIVIVQKINGMRIKFVIKQVEV